MSVQKHTDTRRRAVLPRAEHDFFFQKEHYEQRKSASCCIDRIDHTETDATAKVHHVCVLRLITT